MKRVFSWPGSNSSAATRFSRTGLTATTREFTALLICGVWGRLPRHTISWEPDHETDGQDRPRFDLHFLVRDGSDDGFKSAGKTRAAKNQSDPGEESRDRSSDLDRGLERIVGRLCETAVASDTHALQWNRDAEEAGASFECIQLLIFQLGRHEEEFSGGKIDIDTAQLAR